MFNILVRHVYDNYSDSTRTRCMKHKRPLEDMISVTVLFCPKFNPALLTDTVVSVRKGQYTRATETIRGDKEVLDTTASQAR